MENAKIILYSTHCPKCKVLETLLKRNNVSYSEVDDTELMLSMGIKEAPVLSVNGSIYDFSGAREWLRTIGGEQK